MNGISRGNNIGKPHLAQSIHNQTRKTKFTSYDDSYIEYDCVSENLKELNNDSRLFYGTLSRNTTARQSLNESTIKNDCHRPLLGNPKYKTQEEYYDELQLCKKEMKHMKDENDVLHAKIRRLEGENARKYKEISDLHVSSLDGNTSLNKSILNNDSVLKLKKQLFELQLQLKQKDNTIADMKTDPRWTNNDELIKQNRVLFAELEKQRIQKLTEIKEDYVTSMKQATHDAIRTLELQKQNLQQENEHLKAKIVDFEQLREEDRLAFEEEEKRKYEKLRTKIQEYKMYYQDLEKQLKQNLRELDKYKRHKKKLEEYIDNFESNQRHQKDVRRNVVDKRRVEEFRRRHAAKVIQRGWRQHQKTHKNKSFAKIPRSNTPPSSPKSAHETFKSIQAALRGHLHRDHLEKTIKTQNTNNMYDTSNLTSYTKLYDADKDTRDLSHKIRENFKENYLNRNKSPRPTHSHADTRMSPSKSRQSADTTLDKYLHPSTKTDNNNFLRTQSPSIRDALNKEHRPQSPSTQLNTGNRHHTLSSTNRSGRESPSRPSSRQSNSLFDKN